jgi:biotin transport system ATP-binding protein
MEPAHLVLDEPFTGLDWPARQGLFERLDALSAAGTSVLIVTHDLRGLFERADRIVALSEGRIALEDTPDAARPRLESIGVRPC